MTETNKRSRISRQPTAAKNTRREVAPATKTLLVGIAAVVVIATGIYAAFVLGDSENKRSAEPLGFTPVTITTTFDSDTQFLGKCSVVTPPEPDPCDAASLAVRDVFFGTIVNAQLHKNWKRDNPGEVNRLNGLLANPQCSTPSNPQPGIMITKYGQALHGAVQAFACALGEGSIPLPTPDPPLDPKRTDKTPPTSPTITGVELGP